MQKATLDNKQCTQKEALGNLHCKGGLDKIHCIPEKSLIKVTYSRRRF